MATEISRIGDFTLTWGESLLWDDIRSRLYFVDCDANRCYWLDDGELPLHEFATPSMPTGLGLVEDGRVLMALEDGLYLFDSLDKSLKKFTDYPPGIGRRANDLVVDDCGGIVTGSLNDPVHGSYWRFSMAAGWQKLDANITNTNGPVILRNEDSCTLVVADTPARKLFAYQYNCEKGIVSDREVFADTSVLQGAPDGACATASGEVLSTQLGPGLIARYTREGLVGTIAAGSELPSDVTFGGEHLERLFVTSISVPSSYGAPTSELAGALVEIKGTGLRGKEENRFQLD